MIHRLANWAWALGFRLRVEYSLHHLVPHESQLLRDGIFLLRVAAIAETEQGDHSVSFSSKPSSIPQTDHQTAHCFSGSVHQTTMSVLVTVGVLWSV
ncbi:hypothetical protein TIFTF001_029068 [Ficus carica]|uniref:Uncharacterized protein n=1 Tax=Ficus carica TaxID=3494 RepID=A0AA88J1Y9_FICCA|nr:hypothetical protein TIFTF001_029068 [Ficus carica]